MALQFGDPLVNGSTLVREAIRSPGYSPGVFGWSINQDGSVDLNNGTFRGNLEVGNLAGGFVNVSDNIPPELAAFYSSITIGLGPIQAFIQFVNGAGATFPIYYYMIYSASPNLDQALFAGGFVSGTGVGATVREAYHQVWDGSSITEFRGFRGATSAQQELRIGDGLASSFIRIADQSSIVVGQGISGTIELTSGSSLQADNGSTVAVNGKFAIDGVSAPRGPIFYESTVANVSTPAAIGEAEVYNSGNLTFENGRAYGVRFANARLRSAAIQNPAVNLRKHNVSGTLLAQWSRVNLPAINTDWPLTPFFIFVNTSGVAVTDALSLTLNPSVATAVQLSGAPGAGAWGFEVVDIGDTNMYAGVSV